MLQKTSIIYILCFLTLLGSGCTQEQSEPVTITVNYPSAQQFYKLYGYAFEDANPGISIQVIQDDLKNNDNPPSTDVVYMNNMPLFEERIGKGELIPLDPLLPKDKFKVDSLSPIVLSLITSVADGAIYGLTSTFQSEALYYNKQLFNKYQISYPRDQMSWQEVFELAAQFPRVSTEDTPLYGMQMNFAKNVSFNYFIEVGTTAGLSYIDAKTLELTINTDGWTNVLNTVVNAFQSGAIYNLEEDMSSENMTTPPFYSEQAAMTKASFLTAYNFEPYSLYPDGRSIDWGMVTVPVDPGNPTISRSYSIYDLYGISANSEHQDAAWKLIKFIVNDATNNLHLSQTHINRGLPSNLKYMKQIPGHDLSPLYHLSAVNDHTNPYLLIAAPILDAFADFAQLVMDDAISGTITVDQALEALDIEGQLVIDEAKLSIELQSKAD